MPVLIFGNKHIKRGGDIKIEKNNPNKFNSTPFGIMSVNSTLKNPQQPVMAKQSIKPTSATISYGGDLLHKLHFHKSKDNKMLK